jgi:hypothetical protein
MFTSWPRIRKRSKTDPKLHEMGANWIAGRQEEFENLLRKGQTGNVGGR